MNDDWTEFTVIIGHRRLAAAKQAGLTELPCAVVKMTEKEQLSTMLTENMQRSDLTVYEEAKGCQLLLDLGDTVAEVAEKTGFSESKIRRRVKLCELDEEAFKESQIRQPTLQDYDRLNKIEDIEERNALLKTIGTNNFNSAIYAAEAKQERKHTRDEIKKVCSIKDYLNAKRAVHRKDINTRDITTSQRLKINLLMTAKSVCTICRRTAMILAFMLKLQKTIK